MGRRARPLEDLRRLLAGIGAEVVVHDEAPPAVAVHRLDASAAPPVPHTPAPLAPPVRVPPPVGSAVRTGGLLTAEPRGRSVTHPEPDAHPAEPLAAPGAQAAEPVAVPAGHTAALVPSAPGAARVPLLACPRVAGRARALRAASRSWPGRVRSPRPRSGRPLRAPDAFATWPFPATLLRLRRRRAEWEGLPAGTLRRGWYQITRTAGIPAARLRLVGIYGPIALGRVAAAGLAPDGVRLEALMDPARTRDPLGYLAVARDDESGRTYRATIVPAIVGDRGRRH